MTPQSFMPLGAEIFPSQSFEVLLGRQTITAGLGRDVRNLLQMLPSDVTESLLSDYKEPNEMLFASIENAAMEREQVLDNAAQGANLDHGWLNGSKARSIDEAVLGADDEWNGPSI